MKQHLDAAYWSERYRAANAPWDLGAVSPPLKNYFDTLTNKNLAILIPGAGNAWEAEYLHRNGFTNTTVCDLAQEPLTHLASRCPDFNPEHLRQIDFFDLEENRYDLMVEQTFFCAIDPVLRPAYAAKVQRLLKPGGRLVGLLFNTTFDKPGPPFGGSESEYRSVFEKHFDFHTFAPAYNSIPPRAGRELFIHLVKPQ